MALINPSSLYTGGNERLNSTPSVNFYAQLAAKKQAKDDAAAEYVRNLTTKITPTGVRSADLPAFNKMYEDWRNRGASNYKEISKNPLAKAEFDAEGQKLLSFIQESKLEEEKKKPFVDILTDPAKRAKLRVSALGAIGEHDKPLYTQDESGNLVRDYARKSLDVTGDLFKEPSFDFQKAYKGWSGTMSPGEVLGEQISKDPTTGKVRINYEKKFSPDQVAQVALNAARGIKDDPDIFDYYDHKLETLSPAEFTKLNEVYQSIPGIKKQQVRPDGVIVTDEIDSPEKLAMAEAAQQAMIPHEKGERNITDRELAYNRGLAARVLNSNLIASRGGGNREGYNLGDYDILGQYKQNGKTTFYTPPKSFVPTKDGQVQEVGGQPIEIIKTTDIDNKDKKLIGEVIPYKSSSGFTFYKVRPESGDWEGKGGQVIYWSKVAQSNLDNTTANEQKRGRLNYKPGTPKPSETTETKTFVFPNGKKKF